MGPHDVSPGTAPDVLAALLRRVLAEGSGESVSVATSGSSGTPKRVELPGAALRASGEATGQVVGRGRWVLALPTHHVAGLQVVARSVLAGTQPVALEQGMGFRADAFAAAVEVAGSGDEPVLTSLVPTQLHRLLADDTGAGARALDGVDVVLLGGAAADPLVLRRAREHTRVVTTYGMSETCGGCVYDGRPLPGVEVRLAEDDRVLLGGPVLAAGYPDLPELTAQRFVTLDDRRWFVTDDRGALGPDGDTLQVLGRVDDVIITGGHKVEPRDVEAALTALPEVGEAAVVGLPDPEWGQVVTALLTPAAASGTAAASPPDLPTLRATLAATLPAHAVPRVVAWSDRIPLLPSGKPDWARIRTHLSGSR